LDGDRQDKRWVFVGGNGHYMIGDFDGSRFTPKAGPFQADYGGNYYATQTFNDIPESDGRRIQIAWMAWGRYPGMPFNQQMNFPCEMTLRGTPEGLRLCRTPVREIALLHKSEHAWNNRVLKPGENLLAGLAGELFDIRAECELRAAAEFGIKCRGTAVSYSVREEKVSCLGGCVGLKPSIGRIRLQVLLDRTSIEVFGNDGEAVMSSCFLPEAGDKSLETYATAGSVGIVSLRVFELSSALPRPPGT